MVEREREVRRMAEQDPEITVEVADEDSPLEAKAEAGQQEEEGGVPGWARPYLPADLRIPRGREVVFLRFKSKWTDAPDKGVETDWPVIIDGKKNGQMQPFLTRVLVCWTLSDAEERFAYKRSRGDIGRPIEELALQMVRAVDGAIVDWTGNWAKKDRVEDLVNPQRVWTELGSKCRMQVKNAYARLHTLSGDEMADFFLNGFSAATAAAG